MPDEPRNHALPLHQRALILALAALVHALLLGVVLSFSGFSVPQSRPLSVNLVRSGMQPAAERAAERALPAEKTEPRRRQQQVSAPRQVLPDDAANVPASTSADAQLQAPATSPGSLPPLPDREPDYRAAYLDNPPPAYPMVARRMGWQGRVVLNVEVLASGLPGQITLHQGSGHEVLDNAALQAVRGWRFVPAQQGGEAVTKWFLVPIPFVLQDAERR